ncbi:MAG: nucleoside-diphosphate sugar epimerase/dehydratase [Christensenellaceae bacterium]
MNFTSKRWVKQVLFVLLDCAALLFAWFMAVWFYSYLFIGEAPLLAMIWQGIPVLLIFNIVVFALMGMYKGIWRYASIGTIVKVALASVISVFVDYVYFRAVAGYWQSPAIPVMTFFIMCTLAGFFRFIPRISQYLFSWVRYKKNKDVAALIPTLIVGAGQSTATLLADMMRSKKNKYTILAIVDDDISKQKMILHGIPVVGSCNMIPKIVNQLDIQQVILSIPSASNKEVQRILALCPISKCKVSVVPNISDINKNSVNNLRGINVSDLLGRKELLLDTSSIELMLRGATVLVTGGGGSIGSELCRQLLQFELKQLIVFDIYENNAYDLLQEIRIAYGKIKADKIILRIGSVQDKERLEEVFSQFKPDIVFHAAAHKHVPLMEECPRQAVMNNVFGTYNVAKFARKYHAKKFVFISTDKAVNPTNIMGASKQLAEKVIISLNTEGGTKFVCVRFGNVLGSNGSVLPIFQRQIEHGGPVTVTHPDITRYFMTIPEAACLVLQAAEIAQGGDVFILDMGEPVKIVELARNVIRIAGYIPDEEIKIEYTGLRPGEKLYEELLTAEENLTKTKNEKIFIAQPLLLKEEETEKMLHDIKAVLSDDERLRACMKEYVPDYHREE